MLQSACLLGGCCRCRRQAVGVAGIRRAEWWSRCWPAWSVQRGVATWAHRLVRAQLVEWSPLLCDRWRRRAADWAACFNFTIDHNSWGTTWVNFRVMRALKTNLKNLINKLKVTYILNRKQIVFYIYHTIL